MFNKPNVPTKDAVARGAIQKLSNKLGFSYSEYSDDEMFIGEYDFIDGGCELIRPVTKGEFKNELTLLNQRITSLGERLGLVWEEGGRWEKVKKVAEK